jgi:hypothetical protein
MNVSVKWKLVIGLSAVIVAGTAAGAVAKVHRHRHANTVVAQYHEPEVFFTSTQPRKTCWRYYGGPKGGLWPGECP